MLTKELDNVKKIKKEEDKINIYISNVKVVILNKI